MGPARGEPDPEGEHVRLVIEGVVPQWGRLVESRITGSGSAGSAASGRPQWGRLVERRITSSLAVGFAQRLLAPKGLGPGGPGPLPPARGRPHNFQKPPYGPPRGS